MEAQTSIAKHYGDGMDLESRVEEELGASVFVSGKELSPRDVAGLEQFDVGGAEATEDLARLLAPLPAIHVLDVEMSGRHSGIRPRTASSDIDFDLGLARQIERGK